MLIPCSKSEFEKRIDFFYSLATNLTKSGYPTYCDKIKTKEMFIERSLMAFERDTEEMLLFMYEGEIQGVIQYYTIPDDRYLGMVAFNIAKATEQALSEFLQYIDEKYAGYEAYMGFPCENRTAVEYLTSQGFVCIENDFNNTAFPDKINNLPQHSDIIKIGKENFEKFGFLHSQIEGDMYWNSERILENLDEWVVFVKEENSKPQGAVYYRDLKDNWLEIFGIDIDNDEYNPSVFKELLETAVVSAKQRNAEFITFFCEEEYEEITKECGFLCIGNYLCFKVK